MLPTAVEKSKGRKSQAGGESIKLDEVYTLPEAGRRLSLGPAGMRRLQRDGLRTIKVGRNKFVRGADVLEFFENLAGAAAQ